MSRLKLLLNYHNGKFWMETTKGHTTSKQNEAGIFEQLRFIDAIHEPMPKHRFTISSLIATAEMDSNIEIYVLADKFKKLEGKIKP